LVRRYLRAELPTPRQSRLSVAARVEHQYDPGRSTVWPTARRADADPGPLIRRSRRPPSPFRSPSNSRVIVPQGAAKTSGGCAARNLPNQRITRLELWRTGIPYGPSRIGCNAIAQVPDRAVHDDFRGSIPVQSPCHAAPQHPEVTARKSERRTGHPVVGEITESTVWSNRS
jgi:hypothetical protein